MKRASPLFCRKWLGLVFERRIEPLSFNQEEKWHLYRSYSYTSHDLSQLFLRFTMLSVGLFVSTYPTPMKHYVKALLILIVAPFAAIGQTQQEVNLLKEIDTLKREMMSQSYRKVPDVRKALRKLNEQDKEEHRIDLLNGMFERNAKLNALFVENSGMTTISYARMTVPYEGSHENQGMIDADINANFFVLPKHWGFGLVANPRFNLRMFIEQKSSPIRTPSNRIGATVYKHLSFRHERMYQFVSASFYHHSNGQGFGSYNDDGTLNVVDGNFGVNDYSMGYMMGIWLDEGEQWGIFNKRVWNHTTNIYFKVCYQFDDILNTSDDDRNPVTGDWALSQEYGQNRLNIEGSFSQFRKKPEASKNPTTRKQLRKNKNREESAYNFYRVIAGGSVIRANNDYKINIEVKGFYKLPFSPNFLVSLQGGWLGHDHYNIYFNEQTWVVRLGVAAAILAGPNSKPETRHKMLFN